MKKLPSVAGRALDASSSPFSVGPSLTAPPVVSNLGPQGPLLFFSLKPSHWKDFLYKTSLSTRPPPRPLLDTAISTWPALKGAP